MKEIRLEQNEIGEVSSWLWNETSDLLNRKGITQKDFVTRAFLPLVMVAMVANRRVPFSPLNTLHRRTIDTLDDRSLITKLWPEENVLVLIQSRVNMNHAPWADIRVSDSSRFLRFTKKTAYIYALPDDPQYPFGVASVLYEDPFKNNQSTVLTRIGIADLKTIQSYREVLFHIKSQYKD